MMAGFLFIEMGSGERNDEYDSILIMGDIRMSTAELIDGISMEDWSQVRDELQRTTNTVNPTPDMQKVKEAVDVIKAHLSSEWIVEGCQTDDAFGCASCQAVRLSADLDALVSWLDDEHSPTPAPQEKGR